ncbi:COMT, partial [Symbiodinium microadriaticum]
MGLLLPGAVVVADNVLKPGSPLFLWRLCKGESYDNHVVRVREFAMPSDDWMSVSVLRQEAAEEFAASSVDVPVVEKAKGVSPAGNWPTAPEELIQLQWESDRIRAQATRPGSGSVSFDEWAKYATHMK